MSAPTRVVHDGEAHLYVWDLDRPDAPLHLRQTLTRSRVGKNRARTLAKRSRGRFLVMGVRPGRSASTNLNTEAEVMAFIQVQFHAAPRAGVKDVCVHTRVQPDLHAKIRELCVQTSRRAAPANDAAR